VDNGAKELLDHKYPSTLESVDIAELEILKAAGYVGFENNLLRHSGRGLFLMGAFMDDMKVRKVLPSGTEVTLVKNVAPRK